MDKKESTLNWYVNRVEFLEGEMTRHRSLLRKMISYCKRNTLNFQYEKFMTYIYEAEMLLDEVNDAKK